MKRDDLKCRSAVSFLFSLSFFYFAIRLHYLAETSSAYYEKEVLIEESQKPAGKFYLNCNL